MHIVVVDITIQGDLTNASANYFHTVVPFHNLLTIWFSYGQIILLSAFRVFGISPFAFLAYVFTSYPYLDEKPAHYIFQRTKYNFESFLLDSNQQPADYYSKYIFYLINLKIIPIILQIGYKRFALCCA